MLCKMFDISLTVKSLDNVVELLADTYEVKNSFIDEDLLRPLSIIMYGNCTDFYHVAIHFEHGSKLMIKHEKERSIISGRLLLTSNTISLTGENQEVILARTHKNDYGSTHIRYHGDVMRLVPYLFVLAKFNTVPVIVKAPVDMPPDQLLFYWLSLSYDIASPAHSVLDAILRREYIRETFTTGPHLSEPVQRVLHKISIAYKT